MDIKTTVENAEGQENQAPPVTDRVIDMAVEFGNLRARYDQTANELMELKLSQSQTATALSELLSELREMKSRQISTEVKTEQVNESLQTIETELEQAEESSETLEITPPMEIHMEIDQKPAQSRSLIQKLIYGSR